MSLRILYVSRAKIHSLYPYGEVPIKKEPERLDLPQDYIAKIY